MSNTKHTPGRKLKVIIQECTSESIEETKKILIKKCKSFFQSQPFATKVYVALKTGIEIGFIKDNWTEITGGGQ